MFFYSFSWYKSPDCNGVDSLERCLNLIGQDIFMHVSLMVMALMCFLRWFYSMLPSLEREISQALLVLRFHLSIGSLLSSA